LYLKGAHGLWEEDCRKRGKRPWGYPTIRNYIRNERYFVVPDGGGFTKSYRLAKTTQCIALAADKMDSETLETVM
jgi:hypothetical protein